MADAAKKMEFSLVILPQSNQNRIFMGKIVIITNN
jgi:hypothetical protein